MIEEKLAIALAALERLADKVGDKDLHQYLRDHNSAGADHFLERINRHRGLVDGHIQRRNEARGIKPPAPPAPPAKGGE